MKLLGIDAGQETPAPISSQSKRDTTSIQNRDYKRRRQSYRAKNVHITKRTPTQVARHLVQLHMEALAELHATAKHDTGASR